MVRVFDETYPIVLALVWGELTGTDVEAMRESFRRIHQAKRRFYLVVDARGAKLPDAVGRRGLAEMTKEFEGDIDRNVCGIAVIVGSRLIVGAVNAIYWVAGERVKTHYFNALRECVAAGAERLAAEGLQVSASARDAMARLDHLRERGEDPASFFP